MAEFRVGEKVLYYRKHARVLSLPPTVEAVVESIETDFVSGRPIYTIRWLPKGSATVGESQLSHCP